MGKLCGILRSAGAGETGSRCTGGDSEQLAAWPGFLTERWLVEDFVHHLAHDCERGVDTPLRGVDHLTCLYVAVCVSPGCLLMPPNSPPATPIIMPPPPSPPRW